MQYFSKINISVTNIRFFELNQPKLILLNFTIKLRDFQGRCIVLKLSFFSKVLSKGNSIFLTHQILRRFSYKKNTGMLKKNITIRQLFKKLIINTIQSIIFNSSPSHSSKDKKNKKKSLYSRKKNLSLQLIICSLE